MIYKNRYFQIMIENIGEDGLIHISINTNSKQLSKLVKKEEIQEEIENTFFVNKFITSEKEVFADTQIYRFRESDFAASVETYYENKVKAFVKADCLIDKTYIINDNQFKKDFDLYMGNI